MIRQTAILCISLMVVCFAAAITCAATCNALTPDEKAAGWELLFDGKTLDGWKATDYPEDWGVEDGAIACKEKGKGYLATVEKFGNFKLSLEFKMEPGANSGIFFRWADLTNRTQRGAEMQIIDAHGLDLPDKGRSGAIYEYCAPKMDACKPIGEWNKVVLTVRNNLIWVDMNDKRIIYMDINRWTTPGMNPDGTTNKFSTALKDLSPTGYIALQNHGGKSWFRNIKIKCLP